MASPIAAEPPASSTASSPLRATAAALPEPAIGPGEIASILEPLRGGIRADEGLLLARLAANCGDGCIVEVGSFRGKSAVAIALGVRNASGARPEIFCIEPHRPFIGVFGGQFGPADRGKFYRTMLRTGVVEDVALINLTSREVTPGWHKPVGFLFIDGDHTYPGVRSDFELWKPHLLPGAIVAFDDATRPDCGPFRLIREILGEGEFKEIERVNKIVVLRKIGELGD